MTSNTKFPPFPDNVPTVPIARVSHAALCAGDPAECQKVLTACTGDGFFYLDLTQDEHGRKLIQEAEALQDLARTVFAAPEEEKMEFLNDRGKSLFGYKPFGNVKTTNKDGARDTTEFYNIAKDHLHHISPSRSYPPEITSSSLSLCQSYTSDAHACARTIMRVLASQMGVSDSEFTDRGRFDRPSGDHIRLTRKIPSPPDEKTIGLASHTDFGMVTILFNWLGGLQIQSLHPENKGEWCFVRPLPGHAIINLGDAMVKFTNGRLKSAKHRVVPAPGKQGDVDRYSVVYFSRPADETLMEPLSKFQAENGETVRVGGKVGEEKSYTAGEWMVRRLIQMGH